MAKGYFLRHGMINGNTILLGEILLKFWSEALSYSVCFSLNKSMRKYRYASRGL